LFRQYSLELAKQVFNKKTLSGFYIELIKFIELLGLPQKYTDFKQITSVSKQDIE
jgi:hypothetical protein